MSSPRPSRLGRGAGTRMRSLALCVVALRTAHALTTTTTTTTRLAVRCLGPPSGASSRRDILRFSMETPGDDGPRVKFRTRLEEPKEEKVEVESRAEMSTINKQLLEEIEAAKSSIRLEAPQIDVREEVDVSDVNPIVAVATSVVTVVAATFMWQFTTFLSVSFAEHPFHSDFYPVERLAGFIRQGIVAASSLLTGLTAAAGLGVGVLGINVAFTRLTTGAAPSSTSPGPADAVVDDSADTPRP
mmetsp:Transcript_18018/g.56539  ORF Transcript_18018/g.56539 Transcript_18018/m.56539 type:complete len:244 (-) Transcript_18018:144-875(-)